MASAAERVEMSSEIAIGVRDLRKVFEVTRYRSLTLRDLLWILLKIAGFNVSRPRSGRVKGVTDQPVTALDGISLEIGRGSVVFLTGPSRSGKSTLLRILSGTMVPTSGRAMIRGQIATLLGRRESLDRGSVTDTIRQHFALDAARSHDAAANGAQWIIDFAELAGFEYAAVDKLSSGMQLRLNFALALHGSPDVVLIDDLLGVGDIAFQQKCAHRLQELRDLGSTLVIASEDRALIRSLGTRVLVMDGGRIVADLPPSQFGMTEADAPPLQWSVREMSLGNGVVTVEELGIVDRGEHGTPEPEFHMTCVIEAPQRFRPLIDVVKGGMTVMRLLSPRFEDATNGRYRCEVRLPCEHLGCGDYWIEPAVVSYVKDELFVLKMPSAVRLQVNSSAANSDAPLVASLVWETEAAEPETTA
jgi:ABC-type polysaccharide/polyol phosphate transport system ATPase subunit